VATSLFGFGTTNNQPNITSRAAGVGSPQNGVMKSKRRAVSVEVTFSDDLSSNDDHPLINLCPEDRHRHRLLKLAEILAQAARRRAEQQASRMKEAV